MKVRGSLRTRANAQTIWDFVSDPRNDPQWVDATPTMEVTGSGMHMRVAFRQTWGQETRGTAEVVGWNEPYVLIWAVEDGFRTSDVTYLIENGRFQQINQTRFKKRWLAPILYLPIRRQMRKQLRALRPILDGLADAQTRTKPS